LHISFKKRKLQMQCSLKAEMVKAFGLVCARQLGRRLAVLKAAPTLRHVPTTKPDRRHALQGDRNGQFAVDVEHPFRLVFEPAELNVCRRLDGSIDIDQVVAIRILDIGDYH
jgi:toxin HigB-1